LSILGVSASRWTFLPALLAALVAAPVLTAIGTGVALYVGAVVGESGFGITSADEYWQEVHTSVLERHEGAHLLKWALFVNVYRSVGFMASTLVVAQLCARWKQRAQPRHVPIIITSAVVLACLAVLVLDWAFSQLYVRLDDSHLAFAASASDPAALYRDPSAPPTSMDDSWPPGIASDPPTGYADDDGALVAGYEAELAEYESDYAAGGQARAAALGEEEDVDGDRDEL